MRRSFIYTCIRGLCPSSSSSSLACCVCVFLFLFIGVPIVSASSSPSDDTVDDNRASIGRNLLQVKKACSVGFETKDYSIITNKCKGPDYLASLCCEAFKEFACPYANEISANDTDCATTMFSYINLSGKYPPGLFANECTEGKDGLACPPAQPPSQTQTQTADDNGSGIKYLPLSVSSSLLMTSTFVVLAAAFHLF